VGYVDIDFDCAQNVAVEVSLWLDFGESCGEQEFLYFEDSNEIEHTIFLLYHYFLPLTINLFRNNNPSYKKLNKSKA